ncbi:DUF11 domain-containing protein [Comamonadaceae bacterium OH2310_COT-174]|nr:DUF11 domain-containing protein [Comamonadaceae bacterium OH2310_COT-174]
MGREGRKGSHGAWRCVWLILYLLLFWQMAGPAWAQAGGAVCAEVKIVIEQKLSLERQAFDARMVITNGLPDQKLQDVHVELLFMDANNNPLTATSDPSAVGAPFFYRTDHVSGIQSLDGGTIHEGQAANIHWLIIPAQGTGGNTPEGKLYYVGAKLSYTLGGKSETVEVTPEFIVVRPQPLLQLDYFLPRDVHGDDAFTPEVEPPEPFTLGVRIRNVGAGASYKTSIDTAQPRIVENDLGLLIGFEILSGFVADQPAGKSLLLDFGDIAGGETATGRWNMQTTLSGKFVEFDARFSHADALGGAVTSLIRDVHAHTLVGDVRVDLPGRDLIRDFLARDGDVLRVYESDGVDTAVVDQSAHARLSTQGGDAATLRFPAVATGLAYAKVADPHRGQRPIGPVLRSDGRIVPAENVWLSRERDDNRQWRHYINLFDANTPGEYRLGFAASQHAQLSGQVYQDGNGNGIREQGEASIGAVAVHLQGTQTASGAAVAVTAHTEADGSFQFVGLQPGLYNLAVAQVAGLVDGNSLAGNAGGKAAPGLISGIQLGAGSQAQGYAFSKRRGAPGAAGEQADLALTLKTSAQAVRVGEKITTTLQASNQGPATVSDAAVQLALPGQVAIRASQASRGSLEQGKWTLGALASGDTATLTLELEVLPTQAEHLLLNAVIGAALTDPRPSDNSSSARVQIEDAQTLLAEQTLQQGMRALVYIACPDAAANCPAAQQQAVQQLFVAQGWEAMIVTSPQAYGQALRSGHYSLLWLHGDLSHWAQQWIAETQAAAMRGATLVLDGQPHAHSATLAGLWKGGYGDAPLQGAQTLHIDGGATGPASIPLSGPAWTLQTGRGQAVAHYSSGEPAVLSADTGLGMVYAASFDLLGQAASKPALAQWLGEELEQRLAPPVVEPMLAASQVELLTTIHNRGDAPRELQLSTTWPSGAAIAQAEPVPGSVQADQATWRSSHGAGQQSRTVARITLPPQAQASVLHSALSDTQVAQELQQWQFTVRTVDLAAVQAQVDDLLSVAGQQPALADIRTAVQAARTAWDAGQTERALTELAAAFVLADALDGLASQRALQIALAQWLGLAAADGAAVPQPGHGIEAHAGWGQSALVGEAFAQVLVARVTNAEQRPVAGVQVRFVLPDGGASARFVGAGLQATAYTDAQGLAHAPVMQANATAGSFEALAQLPDMAGVEPARFSLSNRAADAQPLALDVLAGHGQSARIHQTFAQTLQVRVRNGHGQPVAAQEVLFTLPERGASARFAGGLLQARALTDAQGLAHSPALTANGQQGSYHATASTAGALHAVQFVLENLAPAAPVHTLAAHGGDGQTATVHTPYAQPLQVRIANAQGQPVAGHRVRFSAPASGPSVFFAGDMTQAEALTDAQGVATAPAMHANAQAGAFAVLASAAQVHEGVALRLRNQPAQAPDERRFSAATPTGTGTVSVSISGGGPQCRFNPANTSLRRAQGLLPLFEVLLFPHGVLDFELVGCEPGSTVTVSTEWPDLQHITGYLKYGPTPGSQGRSVWYAPNQLHIAGRAIRYAITDGGLGDDDLAANGRIRDPGGPVIQFGPLPGVGQPPQGARPIPIGGVVWLLGAAMGMALLTRWRWRPERRRSGRT